MAARIAAVTSSVVYGESINVLLPLFTSACRKWYGWATLERQMGRHPDQLVQSALNNWARWRCNTLTSPRPGPTLRISPLMKNLYCISIFGSTTAVAKSSACSTAHVSMTIANIRLISNTQTINDFWCKTFPILLQYTSTKIVQGNTNKEIFYSPLCFGDFLPFIYTGKLQGCYVVNYTENKARKMSASELQMRRPHSRYNGSMSRFRAPQVTNFVDWPLQWNTIFSTQCEYSHMISQKDVHCE